MSKTIYKLSVLTAALGFCLAGSACTANEEPVIYGDWQERYLQDANYRRELLLKALVNPQNTYSQERIEHYRQDDWLNKEIFEPKVSPIIKGDSSQPSSSVEVIDWSEIDAEYWSSNEQRLIELGEKVFHFYPAQYNLALLTALQDDPNSYGFTIDAQQRVGSLVWIDNQDKYLPAFTCATCHARIESDGSRTSGVVNSKLRFGELLNVNAGLPRTPDPWGPARVDVTPDGTHNALAITDLRPIRYQRVLHRSASVKNGLPELAARIETLIITSYSGRRRPAPVLSLALATYLWSLGEALPEPDLQSDGGKIFAQECGRCHQGQELTGPARSFAEVGTDSSAVASPSRYTGNFRVPSLRGVSARRPLMSQGQIADLDELLNPEREAPGHRFGLSLSASERAQLREFLQGL